MKHRNADRRSPITVPSAERFLGPDIGGEFLSAEAGNRMRHLIAAVAEEELEEELEEVLEEVLGRSRHGR